jgi:glutamine---fructose-6-phosphate transaminase (isomerizing)
MTRFLDDILRQPQCLAASLEFLFEAGRRQLQAAAARIGKAGHVYLTGIGSSYHAALGAGALFFTGGYPVYVQDAAELLHFAAFPPDSVIVAISRSGESAEIVNLLAKARESTVPVIALTNSDQGALAKEAQIPIVVPVEFDHAISVNTYSTLAAAGAALAGSVLGCFDTALKKSLLQATEETQETIPVWQEQVSASPWLVAEAAYYFLARGSSLASCYETRLLWEEGVKRPATAMGTGSFRHGPQEIVVDGLRCAIWIDGLRMRTEDLAVAHDLRKLGASVLLIGEDLQDESGDLVLRVPRAPAGWQFLFDIVPAQLAAERLARFLGVDSDTFRLCSYIVKGEYGLTTDEVAANRDED